MLHTPLHEAVMELLDVLQCVLQKTALPYGGRGSVHRAIEERDVDGCCNAAHPLVALGLQKRQPVGGPLAYDLGNPPTAPVEGKVLHDSDIVYLHAVAVQCALFIELGQPPGVAV